METRLPIAAALLVLGVGPALPARTIRFATDGGPEERKYLWKDGARCYVLEGWGKPVRNVDGAGRSAIWRFDVTGASRVAVAAHVLNSFAFSAGPDGVHFTEVAREEASGGSNEGTKRFDVTPRIGPRHLYLKLEHGAPEKWGGGFGACLFDLAIEIDDDRDRAYARAVAAAGPIALDGVLDEPAWRAAGPLRTFSDRFLERRPSLATTFRLAWDAGHFYIAAECEEPDADRPAAGATAHDSAVYGEECVEVFIGWPPRSADVVPASAVYHHLAVGPTGTTFDERGAEGAASWESGARTGARRTGRGWTVEIALPAASLLDAAGAPAAGRGAGPAPPHLAAGQEWRFGLYRAIAREAQYVAWSCVGGGGWHSPSRFGTVELAGEAGGPLPAANIELPANVTSGESEAVLVLSGIDRAADPLIALDVFPIRSPRLPGDQQDLDPMNPANIEVDLPAAGSGAGGSRGPAEFRVPVKFPVDRFGSARLVASVWGRAPAGGSGRTLPLLSRAVASFTVARQDARPLEATLRQPYVSDEDVVPAGVSVGLTAERRAGARVRAALIAADGTRIGEETRAAEERLEFRFDVRALPLGKYAARFELVEGRGPGAVVEKPLVKIAPAGRPRTVAFDDRRVCLVDGKPVLPLGFMLGEPSRDIVEAGYNCALWGGETLEGRCGLDAAEKNGVLAILHVCNYLRGKNDLDGLRAVVSLRKDEPALFAWYLADEPEAYGDTPEVLRRAYSAIKEIDPRHPVVVLTNAPGMLARYQGAADVIMADPYPVPSGPLAMVADWTDAAVRGAAGRQAVWMTPQGFGWGDIGDSKDRPPTEGEFTTMLYTCLIHGAKGIIWWPYSVPRQKYWAHFARLGRRCGEFARFILDDEPVRGMPAGTQRDGDVHWRAWRSGGDVLVLAVNLAAEPRRAAIPVPAGTRAVEVLFEDREVPPAGGSIAEILRPASGVAYRLRA